MAQRGDQKNGHEDPVCAEERAQGRGIDVLLPRANAFWATDQRQKYEDNVTDMRVVSILIAILWTAAAAAQGVRTVVIDAGHGGKDPGAIGYTNAHEKDIVLNVALQLGEYIEELIEDVEVIYTRTDDTFIELHERAAIANRAQADLFISIHANSTKPNARPFGCETFVLGLHRTEANLEVAKRENSVIQYEEDADAVYEFDPNSPEGHIIMSMRQNAHLEQSIDFAGGIQEQFRTRVGRRDRGVKQAGFLVLYRTTMPSVLIELGFVSNPDEERFLTSEQGQDYMASAIFRAFRSYKQRVDAMVEDSRQAKASEQAMRDAMQAELDARAAQEDIEEDDVVTDATTATDDDLVFRVQVYASAYRAEPTSNLFQLFDDVMIEETDSGMYRHVVNEYPSYAAASQDLVNITARGYKGAFVVAYRDGERVQLNDVTSQAP